MLLPSQQKLAALPLAADRVHNAVHMLLVALPAALIYSLLGSIGYSQHPTRVRPARSASRPRSLTGAGNQDKTLPPPVSLPHLLPSTLPILGNIIELATQGPRLHDWFAEQSASFDGKPFALRMPGKPDLVVVSSPSNFEDIQKTQADNFAKGDNFHDQLADFLGDSLFIVNGESWKRQRQILAKLFSARSLRCHMAPIVQKHTKSLLRIVDQAAHSGELMSVSTIMHQFTLATFAEIGFGVDMHCLEPSPGHGQTSSRGFESAFDDAQQLVADRFRVPTTWWKTLRWLDVGTERSLRQALEVVNTETTHFISESMARRNNRILNGQNNDSESASSATKDLISLIMDAMVEEDASGSNIGAMNAAMVRDLVVTALMAGRDTTADTLSWFLLTLSENPRAQHEIRAELLAQIPQLSNDPEYVPTVDDVQNLSYLDAAIREVMRLYPAGPFTVKQCVRDTVLSDGTFIHAGTDIGLAVYAMGRLHSVWGDDASAFKPERFLDEEMECGARRWKLRTVSPFQFSAFSAGARQCVGRRLAMLEMKVALAALLARFRFEAVSPRTAAEQTYTPGITLPMKTPLQMRVHPCR